MKTTWAMLLMLSGALTQISFAQNNAFLGTWKLDAAQSHLTGDIITYAKTAKGYRFSYGKNSELDFAIDGREYKDPDGYAESWTAIGPRSWRAVLKLGGKVVTDRTIVLSDNDKTMTVSDSSPNADGSNSITRTERERQGNGAGLAGRWKSTKVTADPVIAVISQPSAGRLRFEIAKRGEIIDGPMDGTEFPMQSLDSPPGWVATFKMVNSHEHTWSGGFKGQPEVKGTSSVSEDGKTLTIVSWAVGKESEKWEEVYKKQ